MVQPLVVSQPGVRAEGGTGSRIAAGCVRRWEADGNLRPLQKSYAFPCLAS